MSESGSLFQILAHDNFEQTNGIHLECFTKALCWEYYSKPKNLVSYTSKIIISCLKVKKKKTLENIELFQVLKLK